MNKTCTKCSEPKSLNDFAPHPRRRDGRSNICILCVKLAKKERDRVADINGAKYHKYKRGIKNAFLKRKYGITIDQLEAKIKSQDGKCAICNNKRVLVVDHDHSTGQVRDLLCSKCNTGIGSFSENVIDLSSAIRYIQKWSVK